LAAAVTEGERLAFFFVEDRGSGRTLVEKEMDIVG
jgi:hypothetical protein